MSEIPTHTEFVLQILNLREVGQLSQIKELILNRERSHLSPHVNGSGKTPGVLLGRLNWADFALERRDQKHEALRILEIGAGDTCTPWTAPLEDERLDDAVKKVRTEIPDVYVVGQSACNPLKDPFTGTCVREFYAGHFFDVLSKLRKDRERFDVILSRHALYMTSTVLDLLPMIDDLLTPGGAAFLDTVSKGVGNDRVLIYPELGYPFEYLTPELVRLSLRFTDARIGGLNWGTIGCDGVGAAWKKGEMDRTKMPSLVDVNLLHSGWQDYGFFDFFRLIYTQS